MFGRESSEPFPYVYLDDPQAWDGYVAEVWHQLFRHFGWQAEGIVVEIAPGSSAKVGQALAKSGFNGRLYVVDASAEALGAVMDKYRDLLPHAALYPIHAPFDLTLEIPRPDALFASHVMDDMLIAAGTDDDAVFAWATQYTNTPAESLRAAWRKLEAQPTRLAQAKDTVRTVWREALHRLDPAFCVLSQYPSSTLYDHGMQGLNTHADDVFQDLKAAFANRTDREIQEGLNGNPHYGNTHIGTEVLNAAYWMVRRHARA